ncbi:hypothetical protein ARMGADRAFT_1084951 [Armillaria gallica]|uniref:Uncharacterized protein n=1 Tax=Armillaria gallica TaxID=47427 RepID=A0A2H3D2J7_ARMGA|nr:hypothetical protein ARMGADRAFT_1084951 [Armillaria gallica]
MFDLMIWNRGINASVYILRVAVNGNGGSPFDIEQWIESMKDVKAPVTVYVAKKGAKPLSIPEEEREDLGASRWLPGARVVRVPRGHMDFLEHDLVIGGLQEGYL